MNHNAQYVLPSYSTANGTDIENLQNDLIFPNGD